MKRIYRGIEVESSLPLDSILFQEPEKKKPTPANKGKAQTKTTRKKETK
jgi:hypothetical protein